MIVICFVLDLIFGGSTKSIHSPLSSKMIQCTIGIISLGFIEVVTSISTSISDITCQSDCDNATYLLSVVDSAISVCSFEHQIMEQFAYIITYPDLDIIKDGSSLNSVFHSPANDASTKVMILFVLSVVYTIPCVFSFSTSTYI